MAKGDELQRVGRAVAARRGQLGMTQQELADAAHVDLKTIYNLESGTRWPIAKNRSAVSAALGWEADALAAIADRPPEGAPTPDEDAESAVFLPLIRVRLDELTAQGNPRPSGDAMFTDGGDPLGAGDAAAAGLARAWDVALAAGVDLDTAAGLTAKAWARLAAYLARKGVRPGRLGNAR